MTSDFNPPTRGSSDQSKKIHENLFIVAAALFRGMTANCGVRKPGRGELELGRLDNDICILIDYSVISLHISSVLILNSARFSDPRN